jgi:hypothetical protein
MTFLLEAVSAPQSPPRLAFCREGRKDFSMRPICDEADLKAETVATDAAAPAFDIAQAQ